ncbi:MAG: hypothetical protein DMG74_18365 [Acidobacteria bacterium]|nr:MAG: hypothetical protein DMG74_18365 [Acidobacteriota bacterium]
MSDFQFQKLDQWITTATFHSASEMQKRTLTDTLQMKAQANGRAPLNSMELAAAFQLRHASTMHLTALDCLLSGSVKVVGERNGEYIFAAT